MKTMPKVVNPTEPTAPREYIKEGGCLNCGKGLQRTPETYCPWCGW
ncbi:MAG: hypothetical protein OXT06_14655 [Rhodospirillaceae bacterium]|nr:hypothetical protein [Rhodospirillaceae bacterium]